MNSHPPAPGRHPSNAGTVSILGRLDGSTVTISTQPGPSGTARVVLLRVQSPMLDALAASFLAPDEAHLLAAELSSAASAAAEPPARNSGGHLPGGAVGGCAQHIVSAAEDTTVEELGLALASVPAHSRLTDFASDVDVTLIFTSPTADPPEIPEIPETPADGHPRGAE